MRKSLIALLLAGMCCAASAADHTTPLTVPSADNKLAITLQLAEGWKTHLAKDGMITIEIPKSGVHIQVWALRQSSVDEAAKQVAELIKSQVTEFKVSESKAIRVADAAAKQLTGTGEEADDSDPSNAEVYLFAVEGKVFMICAHGEGDGVVKNRALLTALLASVKQSERK